MKKDGYIPHPEGLDISATKDNLQKRASFVVVAIMWQ